MTVDDDGSIDIVTTQVLRADRLPGVVPQFHRGDLSRSNAKRNGARSATAGRPRPSTAHPRCAGDAVGHRGAGPRQNPGAGSRLEFKATVEVDVPLVGGKIETFIGSQLVDLLIAEQRFTTVWITENA